MMGLRLEENVYVYVFRAWVRMVQLQIWCCVCRGMTETAPYSLLHTLAADCSLRTALYSALTSCGSPLYTHSSPLTAHHSHSTMACIRHNKLPPRHAQPPFFPRVHPLSSLERQQRQPATLTPQSPQDNAKIKITRACSSYPPSPSPGYCGEGGEPHESFNRPSLAQNDSNSDSGRSYVSCAWVLGMGWGAAGGPAP
jgi:hypothetical protein